MNKILISIVGPTAIGKTTLAIALAQHFNTEIISADSRQFYKEMTIGTAVPSNEELQAAPHHFIQHRSIKENYTVGDFEKEALQTLEILFKEKDIAILVGGSGLYVDAVTKGLDYFPAVAPQIRATLNEILDKEGVEALQEKLQELDPSYYEKVDVKNPHRLIRALEICIGTGNTYSSYLAKEKPKRPFKVLTVGLQTERALLYERIAHRVDLMVANGLKEEVRSLLSCKELNALRTVGYKEYFHFFEGTDDEAFAISEIKKNTRRFAKRQLTWFKRNKETHWISINVPLKEKLSQITDLHNNISSS